MIELYDFKLIKSGKEIEVYVYKTKKILKGYTRKKNLQNISLMSASQARAKNGKRYQLAVK